MAGGWLLLRLPLAVVALCAQAAPGDSPARAALASAKAKGNNGLAIGRGDGRPATEVDVDVDVDGPPADDYVQNEGADGNGLETDQIETVDQSYDELESLSPDLQEFAAMHPDLWEKIKPAALGDKAAIVQQAQQRTMDDYLALRDGLPRRDAFPSEELMQLRLQVMFEYMDRLGIVPVGAGVHRLRRLLN